MASDSYKQYNEDIPDYLHNRPKKIVQHCMKRLAASREVDCTTIHKHEGGFSVKSSCGSQEYNVKLCNEHQFPKCTCEDFKIHFLPCKHMFAIFNKYPEVSWDSFPEWYRNSVFMTLDESIVIECKEPTSLYDANLKLNTSAHHIPLPPGVEEKIEVLTCTASSDQAGKKKVVDNIATLLKEIRSVSFDMSSLSDLKTAETGLQSILSEMRKCCKVDSGLRIRDTPDKNWSTYRSLHY